MEDIKRRLEFKNTNTQSQAAWKLYGEVTRKRPENKIITAASPEFLELKTLWEYSASEDSVVGRTCSEALVQLVLTGNAEFGYVLNGFLNQVPSAKNLHGIVEGVASLLKLQVTLLEAAGEEYVCPYGIRSPPHPFVGILTNRPVQAWPLLVEEVVAMIASPDSRVSSHAVQVLEPFLKFVLLEPHRSEQYGLMRINLQRALCNLGYRATLDLTVRQSLLQFLVGLLPGFQISSVGGLTETTLFCTELLLLMTSLPELIAPCARKLVAFTLSLCEKNLQVNTGISAPLQHVLGLGEVSSEVLGDDVNIGLLGNLLLRCHEADVTSILKIVLLILKTKRDTCALILGMVLMPTLQILARPKTESVATSQKSLTSLACDVMRRLEDAVAENAPVSEANQPPNVLSDIQLSPEVYEVSTCVHLARIFSKDQSVLKLWLVNLKGTLARESCEWRALTPLVASVLLVSRDTSISMLAVDRLVDIAGRDPTQAPCMLPVLLHALGRKRCPRLKLHLMEAIPKSATHKVCVGPVLRTLQSLGLSGKLKPLSVRLLTELWRLQDRCFPQLLAVITENATAAKTLTSMVDDLTLAKASAIRDVCKLRPEQHGSDMLKPLSDLLDNNTDEVGAPVAALALDGLYFLCEAEVIDIMSAWSVLESKLSRETRPVVMEQICKLFSLVPVLEVKTDAFEAFLSEVVRRLWLYGQTDDHRVCTAAFKALSAFSVNQFKISHFPFKVVDNLVLQAEVLAKQQELEDVSVDDIFPAVPGSCYTRLLKEIPEQVLEGYEEFLCSMVGKEVDNLPRGIHYSSIRQRSSAVNQGRSVGSIPTVIQSQYDKTKQPGLRPALAASLLFCYDPPLEVGRDGRPRRHYALSQGKNYQQMFSTLMAEVPVQPSEWHRSLLLPQAWVSFMDRLFIAMLQARKTEIDTQLARDIIDEEESDTLKDAAWLWVRETVADMIKGASRGNPTMQSNCTMALAGLALCMQRYSAGLDPETQKKMDEHTQYKSHTHWLAVITDTIMSLVDHRYPTKSTLLGLCQQRTVQDRLPASVLAQSAAFLALSQLVPVLITVNVDLIYSVLNMATDRLPGKPCEGSIPAPLRANFGLGLGMFLSRLCEECFTDVSGTKGTIAVVQALDALEECCLSDDENRSGSLLGLGLAISALCKEGKTDSRVHVSTIQSKLMTKLETMDPSNLEYQAMSVCVACVSGSAFTSNIIDKDRVNAALDHLSAAHAKTPDGIGVCLSLGMLCYSVSTAGHPSIAQVRQDFLSSWMDVVAEQENSIMTRLAALNGLLAMIGSERTLIATPGETTIAATDVNVDKVISLASKVIATGSDIGFQGNAAWMLGHLYLSACIVTESRTSVPTSYSYLPDSSLLRAGIDFLIDAGKQGPESVSSSHLQVVVASLQREVKAPLPPVNWAGVLSPLMRLNFSTELTSLCLRLAINQCASATTSAMFLTSWLTPPLFNTLQDEHKMILYRNIPSFLKAVPATVLQTFLEKGCLPSFEPPRDRTHCLCVLLGLHGSLKIPDPPEAACAILYQKTAAIYHALKDEPVLDLQVALSCCLSCFPDAMFDQLTTGDCVDPASITRGTVVRCFNTGSGHQPIALLNSGIDAAFNEMKSDYQALMSLLVHGFSRQTVVQSETTRVQNRLQWLVEILGHVRNITSSHLSTGNMSESQKVLEFAVNIIAGAICLWVCPATRSVLGLDDRLLGVPELGCSRAKAPPLAVAPVIVLQAVVHRLAQPPWNQVLPKVIEWLVFMVHNSEGTISEVIKGHLKGSLNVLRDSQDFAKATVWTSAFKAALS